MLRLRGLQLSASLRRQAPIVGRSRLLAAAGPRLTQPLRRTFARSAEEDAEEAEPSFTPDFDEDDFEDAPRRRTKPQKHRRSWQAQLRAQWPDTGDDAVPVEAKQDPESDSFFEYRPATLGPSRPMKPFNRGELRRILRAAHLARDEKTYQELEDWLSWGIYKKPSSKTPDWWLSYSQAKTEEIMRDLPGKRPPGEHPPHFEADPFAEYHVQPEVTIIDKRDKDELRRFRDLRKNWEGAVDPQAKLGATPEQIRARLADPARREAVSLLGQGGRIPSTSAALSSRIDEVLPRLAVTHTNNPSAELPASFAEDSVGGRAVANWQRWLVQRAAWRAVHGKDAQDYPLPTESELTGFVNALAPAYASAPKQRRVFEEEEEDEYEYEEEEEMEMEEGEEEEEEGMHPGQGKRRPPPKYETVLSPQRIEAPHGEFSAVFLEELEVDNPAPFVKEVLEAAAEIRGATVDEVKATMVQAASSYRAAVGTQRGEVDTILLSTQQQVTDILRLFPALTRPDGKSVASLSNRDTIAQETEPSVMAKRAAYWKNKMPPEEWFTGGNHTGTTVPSVPCILALHPGVEYAVKHQQLSNKAYNDKKFAARVKDAEAELEHLFTTGKVTWEDYIERARQHLALYARQRRSELSARLFAWRMAQGSSDIESSEALSVDDIFTRLSDVRRNWLQLVPPRTMPPEEFFKEIWVVEPEDASVLTLSAEEKAKVKAAFESGEVTMDDYIDKVRLEIRERVVASVADERGITEDAVKEQWDKMWRIVESMSKPEMYNAEELRAEDHQLRLKQAYENDPVRQNAIVEAKERALAAEVEEFKRTHGASELDKRFKSEAWLPPAEYAHLRPRVNSKRLPTHPLNLWWEVPMTEYEETLMEEFGHDEPGPYETEREAMRRDAEANFDHVYYKKPEPYADAAIDDRQSLFEDGKVLEEHEAYMMSRRIDPDELDAPLPKAPPQMLPSDIHVKLSEETKDAVWALHSRDPGRWHPRALAEHFHFSLDMIELILVERSIDATAEAREDRVHFTKDTLDLYRTERDYVWLPPVAHSRYLEPDLMFVSEYDKYRLDKMEARRKQFMLSEHERKCKMDAEFYAKNGPLGTPPKPEVPPSYIPGAAVRPPRKYHTVLTDLSDKRNAKYKVAVRDRLGVMRQPTRAEYWKVRYREKPKQESFTPLYWNPQL